MLEALLGTTDRVVQEIDSVEYGLTDIQEYYANTGAVCCLQLELTASFAPSTCHICLYLSDGVIQVSAFCLDIVSTNSIMCFGADTMWHLQGH